MQTVVRILTFAAVLATGQSVMATRPEKPGKPDCSAALAGVQASVAAVCDCATATNHGQYTRCAGRVVKTLARDGSIARNCKGTFVSAFAKSSCGKSDAVACCVPGDLGTRCIVKRASACTELGGTAGSTAFCSSACSASPIGAFVD